MRVCVVKPPSVPTYVNAGHNLCVFLVASYLREKENCHVVALDASVLMHTWKDIGTLLMSECFDVLAIQNDFGCVDGIQRLVRYAKTFSDKTKTITFGRLSHQAPKTFRQSGVDAVVHSGDYELGVSGYIRYLMHGTPPAGCDILEQESWNTFPAHSFLQPDAWALPNVRDIPYAGYERLYQNDLNKFCGIPHRKELVVPVARGCPIGCAFCDVHAQQGKRERRLSVERTIRYIMDAYQTIGFEYTSFYAPTFTLNRSWVEDFCTQIQTFMPQLKWKCVTTVFHMDEALVAMMAKAGCVRISFGVETLSEEGEKALPKIKRQCKEKLGALAKSMADAGVELNCFVILGVPGDSPENCEYTIKFIEALGGRVRPTIYTPYHLIQDNIPLQDLELYDRQTFVRDTCPPEVAAKYYKLFYAYPYKETSVFQRIPHN